MDPTKLRMRYLLGILVAAVVTAAVLRHFLHVEVGFSPQEIRTGVLIAVAVALLLATIFFRWKRPP
jgi:hypothetical protein